jgi:hypothetical protein
MLSAHEIEVARYRHTRNWHSSRRTERWPYRCALFPGVKVAADCHLPGVLSHFHLLQQIPDAAVCRSSPETLHCGFTSALDTVADQHRVQELFLSCGISEIKINKTPLNFSSSPSCPEFI